MGRNPEKKVMFQGEDAFFLFYTRVASGKTTDQLRGYKSFVWGWSGSELEAKCGYKSIAPGSLATEAERERRWKGHVCHEDLAAGGMWGSAVMKPKDQSHGNFDPPGNLDFRHQARG